jgi:hypothetical protein
MLAIATIRAAQDNDFAATAEVITATEPTVQRLAAKAAQRMGQHRFADYRDEFAQIGRATMWEALKRFAGETEAEFFGFVIKTVESALYDAVRSEKNGGAGIDKDAVWVYSQMLVKANGDPYRAAELAQTEPKAGDRLSADRAHAARLAYAGAASLDAPTGDGNETLADTLAAQDIVPGVVQPKVGHGAALEALAVLQRYSSAYAVLNALPKAPEDVDSIEDAVTLPREASARRAVLDACAILRSYVSTAADGDLVDELRDVSDELRDERAEKHARVNAAVDAIAGLRGDVLRYSFGLGGFQCYGHGNDGDASGLAEHLGKTQIQITDSRRKAYASFAKNYAEMHSAERAAELLAGFAATRRVKGGSK